MQAEPMGRLSQHFSQRDPAAGVEIGLGPQEVSAIAMTAS